MSMTVEEAIEKLGFLNEALNFQRSDADECSCALQMGMDAIKEVQELHAIGTVSEFRELKEKATAKKPTDVRYFGEAGYYIGLCPTCKNGNNSEYEYCGDCGQKLQWFERSEGKEQG